MEPLVVLVTGASSGIGEATARLFAKEGYRVAVAARRLERLQQLADEMHASGHEMLPVAVDIASLESIQNLVETVTQTWGKIDVLVNNAGSGRLNWLDQMDPIQDIENQILINLLGTIQVTRSVLPGMISRKRGHIINMASMAGLVASPTYSIYAATKFGMRGFTEALRREVRVNGVHVSAIYPGGVRTEFSSHAGISRKTGVTTPKSLLLEPTGVAREVLKLVNHPRRGVVLPKLMLATYWFNLFLPGLVDRLVEKNFTIPERFN